MTDKIFSRVRSRMMALPKSCDSCAFLGVHLPSLLTLLEVIFVQIRYHMMLIFVGVQDAEMVVDGLRKNGIL